MNRVKVQEQILKEYVRRARMQEQKKVIDNNSTNRVLVNRVKVQFVELLSMTFLGYVCACAAIAFLFHRTF